MSLHLHIERIVLDGVLADPRQADSVKLAVERELTALLREKGGLRPPSARPATIQLTPNIAPVNLGSAIAKAVHGGS